MSKNSLSNLRKMLISNEQIVYKANPHWIFLFVSVAQIFLFFLLYLFFACPFLGFIAYSLEHYCYIAAFLILFFISLIFYLDWKFNRLYLTNFRIIKERGIIGKRYMSIHLKNIEDISCYYGLWGRIFQFGDLIIESAGTYGKIIFKGISKPMKIKWGIERERQEIVSKVS